MGRAEAVLSACQRLGRYEALHIDETRMYSMRIGYVLLRDALDGRLRVGSNPGVVDGLYYRNIRHDDPRRLERTK